MQQNQNYLIDKNSRRLQKNDLLKLIKCSKASLSTVRLERWCQVGKFGYKTFGDVCTDRSTICSMKLVYLVVFVLAICALKSVQADTKLIEEECRKCKELDGCDSRVCVKECGDSE